MIYSEIFVLLAAHETGFLDLFSRILCCIALGDAGFSGSSIHP